MNVCVCVCNRRCACGLMWFEFWTGLSYVIWLLISLFRLTYLLSASLRPYVSPTSASVSSVSSATARVRYVCLWFFFVNGQCRQQLKEMEKKMKLNNREKNKSKYSNKWMKQNNRKRNKNVTVGKKAKLGSCKWLEVCSILWRAACAVHANQHSLTGFQCLICKEHAMQEMR